MSKALGFTRISVAVLLLFFATAANGNDTRPSDSLVTGDQYQVVATRHGNSQEFAGKLVAVHAKWLVLGTTLEHRSERRVPILSSLPFIGNRLFRSVGIGTSTVYYWIPREAVKSSKHIARREPTAEAMTPPDGEEPMVQGNCVLSFVADGRVESLRIEGDPLGNEVIGLQEVLKDVAPSIAQKDLLCVQLSY